MLVRAFLGKIASLVRPSGLTVPPFDPDVEDPPFSARSTFSEDPTSMPRPAYSGCDGNLEGESWADCGERAHFAGLVFGCTEAKFCK